MSKSKITADIENISPAEAKKMLGKNDNNRHLREKLVNHYVRQIQNNAWEINGETIKVAQDGLLLDGQHRLSAIVKSGKSVEFLVVRGLPKSVMPTIDIGRSRTVGDHLKMQGVSSGSPSRLAATVNICTKFKSGKYVDGRDRLTPVEAISYLDANKGLYLSEKYYVQNSALASTLLQGSVFVACHYIFCKIDKFKAEEFFEKLITGENLGGTSPILKLRTQLHTMKADAGRRRSNKRMFVYYMVAAFTAYLEGRRVDGSFKFTQNAVIELPKKRGGG